ncbi:MAG: hypothetical protein IJV31_08055 [Clostridia bacterium]|nr:hypothetical protein [Clostridia bacterium]
MHEYLIKVISTLPGSVSNEFLGYYCGNYIVHGEIYPAANQDNLKYKIYKSKTKCERAIERLNNLFLHYNFILEEREV